LVDIKINEGNVASGLNYKLKISINISNLIRHNVKKKILQNMDIPAHTQ